LIKPLRLNLDIATHCLIEPIITLPVVNISKLWPIATLALPPTPKDAKLFLARGQINRDQGKPSHALVDFEQAYECEKRDPHVLNELAWFLATCPRKDLRDGPRAVTLAERGAVSEKIPDLVFMILWRRHTRKVGALKTR
jgi:hypothetical protein